MGDISEIRGLVVVITFVATLFLLIQLIPYQFYSAGSTRTLNIPDVFDITEVYSYAEVKTLQTNETGGNIWWIDSSYYGVGIDIGGHDVDLYYKRPTYSNKNIFIVHIMYEWWIIPADHRMNWYNREGLDRGGNLLLASLNEDLVNGTARYNVRCSHFTLVTQIAYNTTAYPSGPEAAWDAGKLYFFFGINFDDINTSYNAFALIGMLLFFQLPEVHPIVNAIIAIPIWVVIIYLIYVLIIKVIPLIAGG